MGVGRTATRLLRTFARTRSYIVLGQDQIRITHLRKALLPCGTTMLAPRVILGRGHPYHSKCRRLVHACRRHNPAHSQSRVDTSLHSVSSSSSSRRLSHSYNM